MTSGYGFLSPHPGEHQRDNVWYFWIFISLYMVYPLVIKCDWLGNAREKWQVSMGNHRTKWGISQFQQETVDPSSLCRTETRPSSWGSMIKFS